MSSPTGSVLSTLASVSTTINPVPRSNAAKSAAEMLYDQYGRSFSALVMLCTGLKNDHGEAILDLKEEPWKTLQLTLRGQKQLKQWKPNSELLRMHCVWRHYHVQNGAGLTPPRPKQWLLSKIMQYLEKHVINATDDVAFLTSEVAKQKALALASIERDRIENAQLNAKKWTGDVPYLRLIHCLVDHDDVKHAYLHKGDISGDRLEVDNRNSIDKRAKTVWEMLSEKWNDPLFNPVSVELPNLVSNFASSIDLSHATVANLVPATPEKCQSKISSLIVLLKRRIAAWEASGQGDGGGHNHTEDDPPKNNFEFGTLTDRPQGALDQRHAFFNYEQMYLLYWWEMLWTHGLLSTAFAKLDSSVAAGNGGSGVPSVVIGAVAAATGASLSVVGDENMVLP